jgi:hypothetical protein
VLNLQKLRATARRPKIDRELDDIKINQGRILCELNAHKQAGGLQAGQLSAYEFKVFSQWGEDGIIQFLVANLAIKNRTFIEFGVEDFFEANCRFLLMKDNWSGFVLDGSAKNIERLRSAYFYWRYPLHSKAAFITRENAGTLLEESGFDQEVGILSVDLDGVDYHVLAALQSWRPSILIVEYNAVLGCKRAVSVPYDPNFHRTSKHYSNLYYGASLPAFLQLADARGYAFVGANSAGNNAFFVRRELLNGAVREVALADGFRDSHFREARDEQKRLTFCTGHARRQLIAEMPLVDVVSGATLRVLDLQD